MSRRLAPDTFSVWPDPNFTPETIRTIALARAVTPLVGRKAGAFSGAGETGWAWAKAIAAKRMGPIIMRVIT